MRLSLTSEQKQIRRTARKMAEHHFAENAFHHFEDIPEGHYDVLADNGYLGMVLPEKYGGQDATLFETMLAMEGIGEVCPETAGLIVDSNFGNVLTINKFADEKYKDEYLPRITSGEARKFVCTAMSEPQSGSAVTDIETTAEEDGDDYIVNGSKIWVSGAQDAGVFNTFVRFPNGEVGTLLIDRDNPGFNVQEPDTNMYGGKQCEIFIDDARVAKDRELIVGENSFKQTMELYNINRVLGVAHSWVMAKWLFEESLDYVQERETWDTPIWEYQSVGHRITEMAIKLKNVQLLIYHSLLGEELPGRAMSCMVKVYGAKALHEVADAALQNKGAYGFLDEVPESFGYRRLRATRIAGGTSDIHRSNVVKALVKDGFPEMY